VSQKLNIALAKTDHLAAPYKAMIQDYTIFFKGKQSAFKGERKTYEAKPDTTDEPTKRGITYIQTTVKEKLGWFSEHAKEYLDQLFIVEKTNSSGVAITELVVDGVSFGMMSTLELLRLKNVLDELRPVYENIPVRSDAEQWDLTDDGAFKKDGVYESPLVESVNRTTEKTQYILEDPNVDKLKDTSKYQPIVATKDRTLELGTATHQRFTGEWSQRERAEALARRSKLYSAVVTAIKLANEAETVQSEFSAEKLFGYLNG
jgi:hypothetical protein